MLNKIADAVVRYPWLFIILVVGIAVFFGSQLPKAQVDPAVKSQLPDDMPTRVNLDKIEELFGGTDMIMLTVSADDVLNADTLKRLKQMSKQMERIKDFDKVISLFTLKDIRGEEGSMIVDPAVKRIPKSDKSREKLRKDLVDNDMVYGSVVSKDFKHTAIVGFLNFHVSDEDALAHVQKVIDDNPGPETVHIAGMPFVRVNLTKDIRGDMQRFMPVGLLIMLIFLFVCFRQLRGVVLPFVMTIMAIVVAMGLIPLLGWKIQMVTVILPVMLIAVANDYGIHIMARYQEDNLPGTTLDKKGLAKKGIMELTRPILATGITTIAGMLCLLTHIIIPAEQMGVLAAVGVGYALIGSLLFIPAMLSILPKSKPVLDHREGSQTKLSLLDRMLARTARWVVKRPVGVALAILIGVVVIATGIYFLKVDTNPNNYYPHSSEVWQSNELVNANFGGSSSLSIVAEGDIKDPKIMKQIDAMEKHLLESPHVDITTSIAKVVRNMNEVMNDDDPAFDSIPDSRDAIAQYFLLYSMSGEPDDFDRLVDFPYQHANISARINDGATSINKAVVDDVKAYIANLGPDSPFTVIGGFADLFSDLVEHVIRGQVLSLLLSLGLVALLVGILFRSAVAGLLASVPLGLAILLLFGLMGYMNIELNIATAMLSSIMIGVGVDYTIHFLWRYKEELGRGLAHADAVTKTLTTAGRGIVFNALSVVIGFSVLILSVFLPVEFFGILVVVSISACLFGALVLLPAVCLIFKPKFLEPKTQVASLN